MVQFYFYIVALKESNPDDEFERVCTNEEESMTVYWLHLEIFFYGTIFANMVIFMTNSFLFGHESFYPSKMITSKVSHDYLEENSKSFYSFNGLNCLYLTTPWIMLGL